jgi:hypothetical protein
MKRAAEFLPKRTMRETVAQFSRPSSAARLLHFSRREDARTTAGVVDRLVSRLSIDEHNEAAVS